MMCLVARCRDSSVPFHFTDKTSGIGSASANFHHIALPTFLVLVDLRTQRRRKCAIYVGEIEFLNENVFKLVVGRCWVHQCRAVAEMMTTIDR